MEIRRRVNQTWNDFYGKIKKADYEDYILTLLALGIISYMKNLIQNWQNPEIVRFDKEILTYLIGFYVVITIERGIRRHFLEKGLLSNEKFLIEVNQFREMVAQGYLPGGHKP